MGSDIFARCFAVTVGEEGCYTANPDDPGNWTGGEIGMGACHGTKFGISAASYPALDIASLTLDDARAIYLRDYWEPIQGDKLPPAFAMLLFDAAVNSGVATAVRWLQTILHVVEDGILGPVTLSVLLEWQLIVLCVHFQIERITHLPDNPRFIDGWRYRVWSLAFEAGALINGPVS